MNTKNKKVHLLYGVAARDCDELVGMFFDKKKHMDDFIQDLPGYYRTMTLKGISYDDFKVELQTEARGLTLTNQGASTEAKHKKALVRLLGHVVGDVIEEEDIHDLADDIIKLMETPGEEEEGWVSKDEAL